MIDWSHITDPNIVAYIMGGIGILVVAIRCR